MTEIHLRQIIFVSKEEFEKLYPEPKKEKTTITVLKIRGKLLKSVTKVVEDLFGKGLSEQEKEKEMLDLYKEFKDWLEYNHPGVKLEHLQEDLMKLALRNYSIKVSKTDSKAIFKELAELIVAGMK